MTAVDDAVAFVKAALALDRRLTLWPDWRLVDTPVIVFEPGGFEVAIDHPNPQSTHRPIDEHDSITVSSGPSELRGSTAIDIDGTRCGIIDLSESEGAIALPLIFHEAFHVYQHDCMSHLWHDFDVASEYPDDDPTDNALRVIERRILDEARSSDDPIEDLARFSVVRHHRLDQLDEEIATYDQRGELIEGLASYIDHRISTHLLRDEDNLPDAIADPMADRVRDDISTWLELKQPDDSLGGYQRYWYDNGATLGTVLDRIEPSWREDMIAEPAVWIDVIDEIVERQEDLEDTLSMYDFDDICASFEEEQTAHDAWVESTIEEIVDGDDGIRLRFRYDEITGSAQIVFDPTNQSPCDDGVLYSRLFGIRRDGVRVEFTDRPVLHRPEDAEAIVRVYDRGLIDEMTSPLSVAGEGIELAIDRCDLDLTENDVSITIRQP